MRLLALLAAGLFAGSLFSADDKKDEKKVKDEEAIVGVWKVEKLDDGGANEGKEEEVRKVRMEFKKGGKASLIYGSGTSTEMDYTLDPSAKPKAIDLSKHQVFTIPGIYTLDGDTLTVCMLYGSSENPKRDRPTEFKADAKKEIRVITYKRVKEEKKDDKKEEKIDSAKVVGKWKANKNAGEVPQMPLTFEFGQGGEVIIRYGEGKDASKIEGTYKVKGATLELTQKVGGPPSPDTLDIVKLTETELHLRPAGSDKKSLTELERVKDEKKEEKKDADRIIGKWTISDVEFGSEANNAQKKAFEKGYFHFHADKLLFSLNGEADVEKAATYTLDPAASPKTIDIAVKDEKGKRLGLYQLDGDTLTLCIFSSTMDTRPKELKADGKAYLGVFTLKRAKDEKKKDK